MKLIRLAKVDIYPYSEEGDFDEFEEDSGVDMYEAADEVDKIFNDSNIRPSSGKELVNVAILEGKVVGGVFASWDLDHDGTSDNDVGEDELPVAFFDFDVAVKPEARGNARVGIYLIDSAIERFESQRGDYEDMGYRTGIRLWVVNPKLKDFLERHRGFSVESGYRDGTAHMVRW